MGISLTQALPIVGGSTIISGGGGVSGSGSATQIAFWTAATTLSGENSLWWDPANDRLGVGTAAPSAKVHVIGSEDVIQSTFRANAAQTSNISEWQTSGGATLVGINSNGDIVPGVDDFSDLGATGSRWRHLWVGPGTIHVGTNATDEGTIEYDVSVLKFDTDTTTNGDISFFNDDLYLDKSLGAIGIGTTTPLARLTVLETSQILLGSASMTLFKFTADPTANSTAGFLAAGFSAETETGNTFNVGDLNTLIGTTIHRGTGTVTTTRGVVGWTINESTGNVTTTAGLETFTVNLSTGTITNARGLRINDPTNPSGTITNWHGVYVDTSTSATNNYGAYFGNNVGINEVAPAKSLHITGTSNDEFIRLGITGDTVGIFSGSADPNGSVTGQRGSLFLRSNGSAYVNTDDATAWSLLSVGGGTVSGSGTATQVAFWDGATSISGDNGFYWDNVNKRVGVNTTTPIELVDIAGSTTSGLTLSGHMMLGTAASLSPVDPNAILFVDEDFLSGYTGNFIFQQTNLTPAFIGTDSWVNIQNEVIINDDPTSGPGTVTMFQSLIINNNTTSTGSNILSGNLLTITHQSAATVTRIEGFRANLNVSDASGPDAGTVMGFSCKPNFGFSYTGTTFGFQCDDMQDSTGLNFAFFYGNETSTGPLDSPTCVRGSNGYIGVATADPDAPIHLGDTLFGDDFMMVKMVSTVANVGLFTGSTNPNGVFSVGGLAGEASLYFNGPSQNLHINIDGGTTWAAIRGEYSESVTTALDLVLVDRAKVFVLSGAGTINAITTTNRQAGSDICLIFTAAVTVKHNTAGGAGTAPMLLAGSVDFAAAADSVIGFVFDGADWQEQFRKVA